MYISPYPEVEEERLERMLPTIGGRRISILSICLEWTPIWSEER